MSKNTVITKVTVIEDRVVTQVVAVASCTAKAARMIEKFEMAEPASEFHMQEFEVTHWSRSDY